MRVAALAVALITLPAVAAEFEGVTMPDTVTVDGKELKLNGQGLRKKFIFNVYVAGLYVETKSTDGAAILAKDETRRVDMAMLRDLDKKAIVEAIQAGFEKNSGDKFPALKERMEKFAAVIPDIKKGASLTVIYVPGKGTRVEGQKDSFTAEGKDFADALFSVWVGKFPVDDNLKKGMLGAK
jgi:Chalcone isomerase-like